MRYAIVLAGGSGTRLWPMSRQLEPKQLLPLIEGRSLLEISFARLEGLTEAENRLVCAAEAHRKRIRKALGIGEAQYLGEPEGRDTLAALAFSSAVLARKDPEALIGVFTADHLIEPAQEFRAIVASGYEIVEEHPEALLTFGIRPAGPATGFGYLELGEPFARSGRIVRRFHEKPDPATAGSYFAAGPERFLWNSGMFIWKARAFLACVERYEPAMHGAVREIAEAWDTPRRRDVLKTLYPSLKKISVDFGIMERASLDPSVRVAAVPMPLNWRDIGSWSAYAEVCPHDGAGNSITAGRHLLPGCSGTLAASSDPGHLIAAIGCENLIIIHTPDATLVCPKDRAEEIKKLHAEAAKSFGSEYL